MCGGRTRLQRTEEQHDAVNGDGCNALNGESDDKAADGGALDRFLIGLQNEVWCADRGPGVLHCRKVVTALLQSQGVDIKSPSSRSVSGQGAG